MQTFGTNHIYQTDTFNELRPQMNSTTFLALSSKSVFAAMATADPAAIWLMSGWLFTDEDFWQSAQIAAYLGGVERDRMWLLDLSGDARPF